MTGLELLESASNYHNSLRGLQHRMGFAEQVFTAWNSAPNKLALVVRAHPKFSVVEDAYNQLQYDILRGTISIEQIEAFCCLVADFKETVTDPNFREFRNVLDKQAQKASDISEV